MPAVALQNDAREIARTMAAMDTSAPRTTGRSVQMTRMAAGYDIAQTHEQNERHWQWTDSLSADASLTDGVRKTVRERARYEYQNNTVCRGIVLRVAHDLIGTGPRLQVLTGDQETNTAIEDAFHSWAVAVNLAEKLQTLAKSKIVDGEAFAHFGTNPAIGHEVQLDLIVDECDRYQSPFQLYNSALHVDGIRFDRYGNPTFYDRLKHHPGGDYIGAGLLDPEQLPASQVIHLFRKDRPEQHRGLSELSSALRLFAEWRRYKLACMAAAETAANMAAVLHTQQSAQTQTDEDYEAFDPIPIQSRMMVTLPKGIAMSQLKAEHPPNTLDMFERSILREIGRVLNLPFNVVAGDSSGYNFSSAKGDSHSHVRNIVVDRSTCWEQQCMNRIAREWMAEYRLVTRGRFDGVDLMKVKTQWFWDDIKPDLDPAKSANARKTDLSTGFATLPGLYDEKGIDADAALNRQAKLLGVTREELNQLLIGSLYGNGNLMPEPQPAEATDEEA